MTRRVVITGIGAITPIGLGRAGLWSGLRAERSAVGPVTRFDPSPFRSHVAAEVNDFVPTDHLDERRSRRFDRYAQFSVVASRMALGDSEVVTDPVAELQLLVGGDHVAHGARRFGSGPRA